MSTHLNIHSVHIFQARLHSFHLTLFEGLDEKNEALLEKYERYEYLSELA